MEADIASSYGYDPESTDSSIIAELSNILAQPLVSEHEGNASTRPKYELWIDEKNYEFPAGFNEKNQGLRSSRAKENLVFESKLETNPRLPLQYLDIDQSLNLQHQNLCVRKSKAQNEAAARVSDIWKPKNAFYNRDELANSNAINLTCTVDSTRYIAIECLPTSFQNADLACILEVNI